MFNKVYVYNKRYRTLRIMTVMLVLFAIVFAVPIITAGISNNGTLNGDVFEVTGKLSLVDNENGLVLTVNETNYSAAPIADCAKQLKPLQGQTVTLTIPKSQLNSDIRWVVGVRQGDTVIADANETLERMRGDNVVTMTVFGVLMGVMILASGVVYSLQKRTEPLSEQELAGAYCEYSAVRQPCCAAYRKSWLLVLAFAFVCVCCFAASTVATFCDLATTTKIAILVVSVGCFAAMTVVWVILTFVWMPKKEREYYIAQFPFDFSDISHVAMRKRAKEQLQRELKEEREQYPNRYGDGGNGYFCEFTETGVSLFIEEKMTPSAEDIFGEGGDSSSRIAKLSYEQLNFEAVPHFQKGRRPMFVVVKSRLQKELAPDDMLNDLHFLLDTNLLATLRRFDVKVENLENILQNKAQLIEENCTRKNKTK